MVRHSIYRQARLPFPLRQQLRAFSCTRPRREILDAADLPDRLVPQYLESRSSTLLSLHWPSQPPRNVLLVPKLHAPHVTAATVAFAKHLNTEYSGLNIIFEAAVARAVHERLPFPVYAPGGADALSPSDADDARLLPSKVDLITALGGDGTILRAASLFAQAPSVPPVLSFSMGTLGFLGEWTFDEYKRAWREVYMSGRASSMRDLTIPHTLVAAGMRSEADLGSEEGVKARGGVSGWDNVRGKLMGLTRASKILLRHRLKVGLYDSSGNNINSIMMPTSTTTLNPGVPSAGHPAAASGPPAMHAINEVLVHRGPHPHLAMIDVYLNNHFLTETVADGILVSTPTGSTAYSLSAGGPIVHPLVESLLLTPICARSLSFRPLVLPLNTKIVFRLSAKNRGRELELSIDGKRRAGIQAGMEMRIEGERVGRVNVRRRQLRGRRWKGGVPCIIRAPGRGGAGSNAEDDDGWVGGLNGLLKFNYPFGEHS